MDPNHSSDPYVPIGLPLRFLSKFCAMGPQNNAFLPSGRHSQPSTGIEYRTASVTPLFVVCAFECTYVSISDSLWLANVVEVFGGGGGYRGSLLSVRNTLHSSFIVPMKIKHGAVCRAPRGQSGLAAV